MLTGKETARESLRKYIITNPVTEEDKGYNEQMMEYARKMRNLKVKRIMNRELHIFDDCVNSMDSLNITRRESREGIRHGCIRINTYIGSPKGNVVSEMSIIVSVSHIANI